MFAQKQQLVNQVKAWQKQSAAHRESFIRFVKENGPPGRLNYDPARHEEELLSQFLQCANSGQIQLMEPTGEFGAPLTSTGGKGKGGKGGGGGGWGGGCGDGCGSSGGASGGTMDPMQMMMQMMQMMTQMAGGNAGGGDSSEPAWKRPRLNTDTSNDPPGSGRVMVRGFDFNTTDAQIFEHMSQAGEIHAVNKSWEDKGSAIVVFTSQESAEMAKMLSGSVIAGNRRYIDVLKQ